jgi:transcriptional/translational regulatory protein YebC/TACO1
MLVRSTLTKHGGNLGTDGSVSYMFKRRGVIEIENKFDFEKIMDIAIANDALDVTDDGEVYTVYTEPSDFIKVKESLEQGGITEFLTSEITYVADNKIALDDEKCEKVMNLIDVLNDIDDVQAVYHNLDV